MRHNRGRKREVGMSGYPSDFILSASGGFTVSILCMEFCIGWPHTCIWLLCLAKGCPFKYSQVCIKMEILVKVECRNALCQGETVVKTTYKKEKFADVFSWRLFVCFLKTFRLKQNVENRTYGWKNEERREPKLTYFHPGCNFTLYCKCKAGNVHLHYKCLPSAFSSAFITIKYPHN